MEKILQFTNLEFYENFVSSLFVRSYEAWEEHFFVVKIFETIFRPNNLLIFL